MRRTTPDQQIDASNSPSPHSRRNRVARLAWDLTWRWLYRPSPRMAYAWRRLLLRAFGAKLGREVVPHATARIWAPWNLEMGDYSCLGDHVDCYCVDRIKVGSHATVSQYSYLCAASHDYRDPHMRLTTAPIEIGDGAWVAADAFVGPGVKIGEGAVVGARASVFKDVEPWTVVVGNPARFLKKRELR